MSDGDNATPGRPGSSRPGGPGDDNQWLTRSARPKPGAAPWERSRIPIEPDQGEDGHRRRDDPAPAQHTDGVTVADLIAKVSGTRPEQPEEQARHRAEPPPEADPLPDPEPAPPLPVVPAYSEPHVGSRRERRSRHRGVSTAGRARLGAARPFGTRGGPRRASAPCGPAARPGRVTADARRWWSDGWSPH